MQFGNQNFVLFVDAVAILCSIVPTYHICTITSSKKTRDPMVATLGKRFSIHASFTCGMWALPSRTGVSYLETGKVELRGETPITVIEANTITGFFFSNALLLLNTVGGRVLNNAVSSDDK
jgi:hypothetical protein